MKSKYAYVIDMGGTFLKGAIIDNEHNLLTPVYQVEACSSQDMEQFLKGFHAMFDLLEEERNKQKLEIAFLAISSPGPFDYASGVSYMKHKYACLYEKNLRQLLHQHFHFTFPIYFENDVISFLYGASSLATDIENQNVCAITLGTGLGYVLMKKGKIEKNALGSPLEVLYNVPYEDGIMEDYFSGRGLLSFYLRLGGKNASSAYELFCLANQKDERALLAFSQFGDHLGKALLPLMLKNEVSDIYLGGQVSKSFMYFEKALKNILVGIHFHVSEDTTSGALKGLAKEFFK